jgi:ABC-type transport system substrate-binding protein
LATASPWGGANPFRPVYNNYGKETNIPALLTHSRLIDFSGGLIVHPGVIEKWEVSPAASKYTYHLRQDVKFSDGQPLTAKDVAFTIKLSMTKAANINPINMIDYLKGGKAFYDGASDTLPAVQTPDDYTVTIELEAPFASWDQIALTEMNILPAHIYETIKPEDLKDENAPIWYKPEMEPDYYPKAQQVSNVTLMTTKKIYIRVLRVNYTKPYLTDKRVRQALVYGIDRKSLCDTLMNGLCFPWNTFMQIDDWVAPDLQTYDYNPSKARAC